MDEQDEAAGILHEGDVLHLHAEGSWEEWQILGCSHPGPCLTPQFSDCP